MPIDPVTVAAPVLIKLIGLGLSTWKAREDPDLTADDVKAVQSLIDFGSSLAGLVRRDPSAAPVAVRHFALVIRAFGEAFRRQWYGDPHFAPAGGLWARLKEDDVGKKRRMQLERRTRMAATKLREVGDRPAEKDLAVVTALVGDPVATPYYRRLWDAYVNTSYAEPGEEPLIPEGHYREFERHFRLAYAEGLAAPPGEVIRRYLLGLEEDRANLVREIVLRDMASWGSRHVFGTVGTESGLPPMPLGTMYVEPNATRNVDGAQGETRPVTDFVRDLMTKHRVVVVKAHFGHGKSLSARSLAWRWAEAWVQDATPSPSLWTPIFIKCVQDFRGAGVQIDQVIRSALWRHADALGLEFSTDDPALSIPPAGNRTVVLVDGLDEIALGAEDLKAVFRQMLEKANDHRRFVVFSRPEVLPDFDDFKGVAVVELEPFTTTGTDDTPGGQVASWLVRWNHVSGRETPIEAEDLAARGLLDIASTPILLFMLASTWDELAKTSTPPTLAAIYEGFFEHIAHGKHKADEDKHGAIAKASAQLRDVLVRRGDLEDTARPEDAMLWLLSRVAWEANRLDCAMRLGGSSRALREYDVQKILREELGIHDTPQAAQSIYMGVLLALQADLAEGKPRILFGHKSFREFLVARFWDRQLRRIVAAEAEDRRPLSEILLGGELLLHEDHSFDFLEEMLQTWPADARRELFRWAERCFNDEQSHASARSFREDPRPLLRAAALAIGSAVGESGVRARDPKTFRSVLAWLWLCRDTGYALRAARLVSLQADLHGAGLTGAILSRAILPGADMSGADLSRAVLDGANLEDAQFDQAYMWGVNLEGANLEGAFFISAHMYRAHLRGANLRRAHAMGAELDGASLQDAILQKMDLTDADLRGANLEGADLTNADLRGAHLEDVAIQGATFRGARLHLASARSKHRADFVAAGVSVDMLDQMQWLPDAK